MYQEAIEAVQSCIGKTITAVSMDEDTIVLSFGSDKKLSIWDDGQNCCEKRYMRTDDDINTLVGTSLVRVEEKGTLEKEEEGESHDICFLEIGTDRGFITIANHNEHNGYYGGFSLCASLMD